MKKTLLLNLVVLLVTVSSAAAMTYYVDGTNGNDDWDGTSPIYLGGCTGPKKTIQAGVELTEYGDTVIVADGTYTGEGNVGAELDREGITVRSANGPEDCIIDCQGEHYAFDFYRSDSATVIDGFTIKRASDAAIYCWGESRVTIKNCIIRGNIRDSRGGAIHCEGESAPTITNCTITNNTADHEGAGVFCEDDSAPVITNCIISNNWGQDRCGGIFCTDGASPVITNCTISDNTADWKGGGIFCEQDSAPVITNCTISGNWAEESCGGIYCTDEASPVISNCTISDNWAFGYSGECGGIFCEGNTQVTAINCTITNNSGSNGCGVFCWGHYPASLTLERCTINDNWAEATGGGISCIDIGSVDITNCIVSGNQAGYAGGGIICLYVSSAEITNCTIVDNVGEYNGGGIIIIDSDTAQVSNSIIWGNQPEQIDESSEIAVSFSDVQDGWPGTGNIDTDPYFASGTDYHLLSEAGRYDPQTDTWQRDDVTSPCIDAGDPANGVGDEPLGSGGRINMGAYGGTEQASKTDFCTAAIKGDVNNDCRVDFVDFALMSSNWLKCTIEEPED